MCKPIEDQNVLLSSKDECKHIVYFDAAHSEISIRKHI